MSNWIADIANYLRDAGYRGGNVFALEMPDEINEGALVVPPQEGLAANKELPNYYKGTFLLVVRTRELPDAMTLASEAVQLLTMDNSIIGGCKIVTCYATTTPTPFPRNDAGTYEVAVEMYVVLIDNRIYSPPSSPSPINYGETITVFYDADRDSIFVSTWGVPFPDRSLVASRAGDLVTIKIANIGVDVVKAKHYSVFRNEAGNGFASAELVVQYLDAEFSQSDRTSGGDNDTILEAQGAIGGHRAVVQLPGRLARYPSLATALDADIIVGISVGAAADGEDVTVRLIGEIVEGSWNWTPGPIFAGDDGVLTQTPPAGAWIRQVGVAVAPTILVVGLRPAIMTP